MLKEVGISITQRALGGYRKKSGVLLCLQTSPRSIAALPWCHQYGSAPGQRVKRGREASQVQK